MTGRRARAPGQPTPLVPTRARPAAIAIAIASAGVVAALGVAAAGRSSGDRFDGALAPGFYDRLDTHRTIVAAGARLADPPVLVAVSVALITVMAWFGRWSRAALAALAPSLALAISEAALKPLVHRTLGGGLAFPSGHATACFGVAFVVALVVLDRTGPRLSLALAWIVAVVVVLLAMFAAQCIVLSGDHYPTDVVAGAGVALTTTLILGLLLDAVERRLR